MQYVSPIRLTENSPILFPDSMTDGAAARVHCQRPSRKAQFSWAPKLPARNSSGRIRNSWIAPPSAVFACVPFQRLEKMYSQPSGSMPANDHIPYMDWFVPWVSPAQWYG